MEDKYRYYVCELKWNAWECARNHHPEEVYEKSKNAFCSQLIPISTWIPKFFDPLVLSYKTKKRILIKHW